MSLSTLLEAAKYLDYLDSNQQEQQQHLQHNQLFNQHQQQQQPTSSRGTTSTTKAPRRQRFTKKNAANTMLAMSLPANTGSMQIQGVTIPLTSSGGSHQGTSLSSSLTTGSPLSSFASTALFCSSSKASGVASAPSSAASSLSSSDSSSSCGEILMGESDFNQSIGMPSSNNVNNNNHFNLMLNNHDHHNYHLSSNRQQLETNHQLVSGGPDTKHQIDQLIAANNLSSTVGSPNNHSVARYLAATSSGPQLVTMTTTNSASSFASTSAPVDGNIRAGHVIHAATNAALINASPGTSFDPRHHHTSISLATSPPGGLNHRDFATHHIHQRRAHQEGQTYNIANGSFASDNNPSNSPTSNANCPPLIMARVQPMILNSISPSAHHSIVAFQQATASSPTSSSSSYSRHRELHKTLEKNRRAHLRHCFELLKSELPPSECVDKKTSHINIIRSAIRYVLILRQQEVELENQLHRLTKIKNELTENLSKLNINNNNLSEGKTKTENLETSQGQMMEEEVGRGEREQQQPASEQQLSFLLSQSKLD